MWYGVLETMFIGFAGFVYWNGFGIMMVKDKNETGSLSVIFISSSPSMWYASEQLVI